MKTPPCFRRAVALCFVWFALFLVIAPAFGADAPGTLEERVARLEAAARTGPAINAGDNAWLLASSALVLMMTAPGLILFYGGLVRSKNVLAIMMHSVILVAVVSVLWVVFGYSMAFGE